MGKKQDLFSWDTVGGTLMPGWTDADGIADMMGDTVGMSGVSDFLQDPGGLQAMAHDAAGLPGGSDGPEPYEFDEFSYSPIPYQANSGMLTADQNALEHGTKATQLGDFTRGKMALYNPQQAEFQRSQDALYGGQAIGREQLGAARGLMGLSDEFGAQARGELGPSLAELQMRQQADGLGAQQMAAAAGARGANAAAAMYGAGNRAARFGVAANRDAGLLRAQEQQTARANQLQAQQMAGGLFGNARGHANTAAGILGGQSEFDANLAFQGDQFSEEASQRWTDITNQDAQYWGGMQGDLALAEYQGGMQGESERQDAWEKYHAIKSGQYSSAAAADAQKDASVLGALGTVFSGWVS